MAHFEFLAVVKRPGYLIATFGMPVFLAGYAAIIAIPAYFAEKQDRVPAVYGVVDAAGVVGLRGEVAAGDSILSAEMREALHAAGQSAAVDQAIAASTFVFRPYATEVEARAALLGRQLKGFFVIPADYLAEGVIEVYTPDAFSFSAADARDALGDLLRQRLLAGLLQDRVAARVLEPVKSTRRYAITRAGELRDGGTAASAVRLFVPLLFMVLFLLSVLMSSGYLMQGTATEKENKVVEVLLASANPDEILSGKLLGLGAAGLLQIAIWLVMVLTTGVGALPLLLAARMDVPWMAIALAVPFFVLAFLFFGGLILGTGALGANMREAQQLAMVWSLTAALPMMMIAVLMKEPHGLVARVLTWVPFTAGPIVILRASTDSDLLRWWEVAGAMAVLAGATWVGLRLGGRLFRVGLLNSGARPRFREILRQARANP